MGYVQDPNRLRLCEGTCGRMTRNTKMLAADFPDTVVRNNATHCAACKRDVDRANGTYKEPVSAAKSEAQKAKDEALRLAAAHRAREVLEAQRRERQRLAGRRHLAAQLATRGMVRI